MPGEPGGTTGVDDACTALRGLRPTGLRSAGPRSLSSKWPEFTPMRSHGRGPGFESPRLHHDPAPLGSERWAGRQSPPPATRLTPGRAVDFRRGSAEQCPRSVIQFRVLARTRWAHLQPLRRRTGAPTRPAATGRVTTGAAVPIALAVGLAWGRWRRPTTFAMRGMSLKSLRRGFQGRMP
jgi:hypothetical protein